MASGLPDYYRGVDVAYQALAQMIVRPKYGGAISSIGELTVTASSANTVVAVAGKGMIYGGFVYLDYTSTQKNSKVWLEVDGQQLNDERFLDLQLYSLLDPRVCVLSLLKYDDVDFVYAAGFSYGVTFESTLKLIYSELHGTTPNLFFNLTYALI